MSGGHFNYKQDSTAEEFEGQWRDEEINELFHDLFCAHLYGHRDGGLATALDLWLSSDINEESYREYVQKFKAKWFHRTPKNRMEFYQNKLQERCDELKREMGEV